MSRQLDIFGRSHARPVAPRPAVQPSLIPVEVERAADVAEAESQLREWAARAKAGRPARRARVRLASLIEETAEKFARGIGPIEGWAGKRDFRVAGCWYHVAGSKRSGFQVELIGPGRAVIRRI